MVEVMQYDIVIDLATMTGDKSRKVVLLCAAVCNIIGVVSHGFLMFSAKSNAIIVINLIILAFSAKQRPFIRQIGL